LAYSWSYDGTLHEGRLDVTAEGATFRDTWHQPEPVTCTPVPGSRALLAVEYAYAPGWGWRIHLGLREPTGELVVLMTNVAPWCEEARAVRMVAARQQG
jgi:hypothetical protein